MTTVSLAGLRAIEAVAAHGSMTAAANALGYTSSAISQQISRLEKDTHQSLIERQGRGTLLTAAGRILAESAGRIGIELESMNAELQAMAETVCGNLVIAAFPTAARGVVPVAAQELCESWPSIELQLIEADSHHAVDLVAQGTADVAIAHDWQAMPLELADGLQSRHLGTDASDVLMHRTHPLAARASICLEELSEDSWLYETGSVTHEFLLNEFRDAPNPARFTHKVGEYASQIAMVGANLGIALVPRMGRGPLPTSVRAIAVEVPPLRRIYGVWRRQINRRPALAAVLDTFEVACVNLDPMSEGLGLFEKSYNDTRVSVIAPSDDRAVSGGGFVASSCHP